MRNRPKNIAEYVKRFVDNANSALTPYVLTGRLNIEYIRGNQNIKINAHTRNIEDKKNPDARVYTERKIFNRILPIYLTRYGILIENMPIPGFKPSDNSAKKVSDATIGNKFIGTFLLESEFKKKYARLAELGDAYGAVWLKTGIDWNAGDDICDIAVNIEQKGEEQKGTYRLREGRPFIDIIPISEVFVDNLYVESADQVNELVHRRPFSLDYIKSRWGVDAREEDVSETTLASHPQYSNMGFTMHDGIKYAYVYEYYKRPDALYPQGRYCLVINETIAYDGILPYTNANNRRVIPFDLVKLQSIPNYLMGVTVYQQLLPIQETYNAVKNRYLEYVNHIAIGQLYYWEGSLIDKNNFSTKPGKLIGLKRNGRPPVAVQKDKLSVEFINYLKTLEDDMLVAAGLSQLSAYGMSKSNVRTDGVADKIGESDQNKLTNALDNISTALVSAFKKILYLEKERQDTILNALLLAKKDDYVLKYNMKDVDPNQMTIVNREFLMQSDQVVEKKMAQAANLGVYNPELRLSYLSKLEILQALKGNMLMDTLDPLERSTHDLILEEHMHLNDGKVPTAEHYHKHDQHIFEHRIFQISPEVRKLRDEDEAKYQLLVDAIEAHIAQHEKFGNNEQTKNIYKDAKAF